MMGPGEDPDLADLAAELAATGFSPAQILKVIRNARGDSAPQERRTRAGVTVAGSSRRVRKPGPGYVTHEQVLAAIAKAGKALTLDQIAALLPGTRRDSVLRHMRRGIDLGNVLRMGDAYSLTKAGLALLKQAPRTDGKLSHETLLAKLGELGPSSARTLSEALGATMTAIRLHMYEALEKGEVTKEKTGGRPVLFSLAGAPKRANRPAAGPDYRMSKKGENDRQLLKIFSRAKGPLSTSDAASTPEFRGVQRHTVYMAIFMAEKRGLLKKVGPGLYALAGKRKAKKRAAGRKPKKRAKKKAADASKMNGVAHAAPS